MNKLNKVKNDFKIVEFNDKKLYSLKIKNNNINVYDEYLLENMIDNNFNKRYKELLYLTMSINESDDANPSDGELLLLKIEELNNYIINKYSKILDKKTLNKYLKMINILKEKVIIPKKRKVR